MDFFVLPHYWRCSIGVIGGRNIKKVMLYAIILQDVDDSLEKRMLARPAHIKRLEVLKNQGHLILAGTSSCY